MADNAAGLAFAERWTVASIEGRVQVLEPFLTAVQKRTAGARARAHNALYGMNRYRPLRLKGGSVPCFKAED